ncbi:polyphosphate polymerase domain-containing protein [Candidatus Oscillochloris fontis]|uniref:polyphosphate polymerase domain-containing protein n=1 Tax=Candidatus Oscillochloris fontis TaxID=2496868 RepID=UPI00101CD3E6|nr:polyphosphate polymerase domain-containing protein [Candidatus Oscillochloris fontis]
MFARSFTPTLSAMPQQPVALRQRPGQPMAHLLAHFSPISLDQMDAVALQNRTDTKYLLRRAQLADILQAVADQYDVLEMAGSRVFGYQTLYFDTPTFDLYLQHHAGRGNRYKLRSRCYLNSGQSFVELKQKSNKGRTLKQRITTPRMVTHWSQDLDAFVARYLTGTVPSLRSQLWNSFSRITLVNRSAQERVTIDLGLRFGSPDTMLALPNLAVVEVKQAGVERRSGIMQQFKAAGVRPHGFSKYCVGVAMLYPHIKHNRFKPHLRIIEQLAGNE